MQSPTWFDVDKQGLRKTLERRGKSVVVFELLQNGFDENSTEVRFSLTKPVNGKSTLICVDNAPRGYLDLSNAHTMFAESKKKADHKKRGRFNIGEKYVLALCDSATITSTTGQIIFNADGTRSQSKKKTKAGSEFKGILSLTDQEYEELIAHANRVIAPIPCYINGILIPERKVEHEFAYTLPTEIADGNGVSRKRQRKTTVRLYTPRPGEQATLYELGMPVVTIDCAYHVDISQKVPLNIERDNVTPAYLKEIYTAVASIVQKRFGNKPVRQDTADKPANKEAVSQGHTLVVNGAMGAAEWRTIKKYGLMQKAGEVCPTPKYDALPNKTYSRDEYTPEMSAYEIFIQQAGMILLHHPVSVVFINDERTNFQGCFQPKAKEYEMTVNLSFHEVRDWTENYYLVLHEFSHSILQSNDHLDKVFYETVNILAAKLVQLTLTRPDLFSEEAKAQLKPIETALQTWTGAAFARIQKEAAEKSFGPVTEDTIAACEHDS